MTPEELEAYRAKKREAGRKGGIATAEKYGREHMSALGKKGFASLATFARGGRSGALKILCRRGKVVPHRPVVELTKAATSALCAEVGLPSDLWEE